MAQHSRMEASLTSLQIPGGRTVLIDNRIGNADALATVISYAKRGEREGYTVISDCAGNEGIKEGKVPLLHICTLLRPGKHADYAGIFNAMGTLATCHAIERNSETRTQIRWLGNILPEKSRFSPFGRKQIATVFSHSLLLPSGFLDYMILHAVIEMPKSRFPLRMVDAVARIFTARSVSNADHVTHAFLHDFFTMYDLLTEEGTVALSFWKEYRARSLLIGKRVRFRDGKKKRYGKVVSVNDKGYLVLIGRGGKTYELSSQSALL